MKTILLTILILFALFSCQKQEIKPEIRHAVIMKAWPELIMKLKYGVNGYTSDFIEYKNPIEKTFNIKEYDTLKVSIEFFHEWSHVEIYRDNVIVAGASGKGFTFNYVVKPTK